MSTEMSDSDVEDMFDSDTENYNFDNDYDEANTLITLGDTQLMKSIKQKYPVVTIMQIIETGCDINASNFKRLTALHLAIQYRNLDIASKLIKRGADIEAQDCEGHSPLFTAAKTIRNTNGDHIAIEIFCMLLYYGANVNTKDNIGHTVFTYALNISSNISAALMIPYFDDSIYTQYDFSPLYLAVRRNSDLALELLEMGATEKCIADDHSCALSLAISRKHGVTLFKKIWPNMNCHILLDLKKPFLITYSEIYPIRFSKSAMEWIDCLYLLLESPIAFNLLHDYFDYCQNTDSSSMLLCMLFSNKIISSDRIKLLSIIVTSGVVITLEFLNLSLKLFGFRDEFEILLNGVENFQRDYDQLLIALSTADDAEESITELYEHDFLVWYYGLNIRRDPDINMLTESSVFALYSQNEHILIPLILGEEDFDINVVLNRLKSTFYRNRPINPVAVINQFKFFSVSHRIKNNFLESYNFLAISDFSPEFPSLVELSRNEVHKLIRRKHEIKRPYDFKNAVQSLHVPQCIKDIIRFKTPIY